MIHVIPNWEIDYHEESTTCKCSPSIKFENGEMIVIHEPINQTEK